MSLQKNKLHNRLLWDVLQHEKKKIECEPMPNLTVTRVEQFLQRQYSSDGLTRKTQPLESNTYSLGVIQPKLYRFEHLPAASHAPGEQQI